MGGNLDRVPVNFDTELLANKIKNFLASSVYSPVTEPFVLSDNLCIESLHNLFQKHFSLSGWPVKTSSSAIENSLVSLAVHSIYGLILIKPSPSLFKNNFVCALLLQHNKEITLTELDYKKISNLRIFYEVYKPSNSESLPNTLNVGEFVLYPYRKLLKQSYFLQTLISFLISVLFIVNYNLLAFALPTINSEAYNGTFFLFFLIVCLVYILNFFSGRIQNFINASIDTREEIAFLSTRWSVSRSLLIKLGTEKTDRYCRILAKKGRDLVQARILLITLFPVIPILFTMFLRLPIILIIVVVLLSTAGVLLKVNSVRLSDQKKESLNNLEANNHYLFNLFFNNLLSLKFIKHVEYYRKKWSIDKIRLDEKQFEITNINKKTEFLESTIKKCVAFSALITIVILVSFSEQELEVSNAFMITYIVTSLSMIIPKIVTLVSNIVESKRLLFNVGDITKDLLTARAKSNVKNSNVSVSFKSLLLQHSCFFADFESLDLTFTGPKFINITGESGSGKSLLLRTIAGLTAPKHGNVSVMGVDAMSISQKARSRIFSCAGQEMEMIAGTLRDNLSVFSDRGTSDRDLWAVLDALYLKEAVRNLPFGLDTPVTNVMESFSTGEKQRIILAQTLMKQSEILLFDEALSGIPAEMEMKIINNIRGYFKQIYFVSHRNNLVSIADFTISLRSEY